MKNRKVTLVLPWNRKPGFADVQFLQMNPDGLIKLMEMTPLNWDVEIVDEKKDGIDFERLIRESDLVAVSSITASAKRAYEIGDEFGQRGIPTIIGGSHASALPEEALEHFDSVAIGEGDLTWPAILKDLENWQMQTIYRCDRPETLDIAPLRNVDEFRLHRAPYFAKYLPLRVGYYQLQRGCPVNCSFCSVSNFSGTRIRHKSVGFAIDELTRMRALGMNLLVFLDDNIVADKNYAREFFEALKKLKIHWFSQTDVRIADPDILELAVESGMVFAFLGIESISASVLKDSVSSAKAHWSQRYTETIALLRDRKVAIEGAFVFGFDGQKLSSVDEAVEWAIENQIDLGQFKVLTPLPGTKFFEEMHLNGRILTHDWDQYDFRQCVFKPGEGCDWTPQELEKAVNGAYRQFYSPKSIRHRFNRKNTPLPLSGFLRWITYSTVYHATNYDYAKKLIEV